MQEVYIRLFSRFLTSEILLSTTTIFVWI